MKVHAAGSPIRWLVGMCCTVYFISFFARLNYSAVMAEMIRVQILTKNEAGLIGTSLFIAYGVGQLVSGCLGDRMRADRLITLGLVLTTICNFCMVLLQSFPFFLTVWGVNGFAQAMLWPPIVKLLSASLSSETYTKATAGVIASSQAATIVIYLTVPVCISLWNWQSVFWLAGGLTAGVCCVWGIGFRALKFSLSVASCVESETAAVRKSFSGLVLESGLLLIFGGILLQGLLRDGITSWLPTYLFELFSLPTTMTILLNLVLPVCSIGGIALAGFLFRRVFRNEVTESVFFFGGSLFCCGILALFGSLSLVVSLVFSALVTGCMHGVNLMLISYVPRRFRRYGRAATASGITNAFTYLGSASSSYGFAVVAGRFGWEALLWSWVGASLLGLLLLLVISRKWTSFSSAGEKSDK